MPRNFSRRWFGGTPVPPSSDGTDLPGQMTAAFLSAERVLAETDEPVRIAHELDPRSALRDEWSALRDQHAVITSDYLTLSQPSTTGHPHRPDQYTHVITGLTSITDQMNRFANAHSRELGHARMAAQEADTLAAQAQRAANQAANALGAAPARLSGLATVVEAADALAAAIGPFEQAHDLRSRQTTARALITAAGNLESVLADAPDYAERAQRVLRSVETRRDAITNRKAGVPATLSTLRREFSAACSADLEDTEAIVNRHMDAAEADLATVRARLTDAPDRAIRHAESAREDLDAAEEAVDAVFDRLQMLREVRADPGVVSRRVRFRLRDAQQFAVNNHLVAEWGTVLDAQADRIERAESVLTGVHPDYWSYLSQLRAVDTRIGEIVDRMRGQVAAR